LWNERVASWLLSVHVDRRDRSVARVLLSGVDTAQEARRLRDAGHEVVMLGEKSSAEEVVSVAVQEDVALVALADAEQGAEVAEELGEAVVVFWVTSDLRPSSPPDQRD